MAEITVSRTIDPTGNGQAVTGPILWDSRKLIRAIREERQKERECLVNIRHLQAQFVECRWRIGRLLTELTGSRAKYGEHSIKSVSDETGIAVSILYECRAFYTTLPQGISVWAEATVEREGSLLWRHVTEMIWRQDDETKVIGQDAAVQRDLARIEREAARLGKDMRDVIQRARGDDVSDDTKDQVLGVAVQVLQLAQDRGGYQKGQIPRSEDHLNLVRQLPCYYCGSVPARPHHYEAGGASIKGNDFATVPTCDGCHTVSEKNIHALGWESWEEHSGVTFDRAIADTLCTILSGSPVEWRVKKS